MKMKKRRKYIISIMELLILSFLTGCGGTQARKMNQSSGVKEVLEAGMTETPASLQEEKETSEPETVMAETSEPMADEADASLESQDITDSIPLSEETEAEYKMMSSTPESADSGESEEAVIADYSNPDSIEVDLTQLSSTMVYSEVYNMMMAPEEYLGKTVKMKGLYSRFHDAMTEKDYTACIVQDATACCAQGIEFVLTPDYRYPEDYPEENEEITVAGEFSLYQEGEYTYFTLKDARLLPES